MMPGPNIIRICTYCQGEMAEETLLSGNTFGGRFWTDGYRRTPMLPIQPWLVACPHCLNLVWIDELPERKVPAANDIALLAEEPAPEQMLQFLGEQKMSRQKQAHIRRCLWWAGNHSRRDGGSTGDGVANGDVSPLTEPEIENLQALATVLDGRTAHGRLAKGEVMRELGNFSEARRLLLRKFEPDLEPTAQAIRGLAENRNPWVSELWRRGGQR